MAEIKSMLNDYGMKSSSKNPQRVSDLLREVEMEVDASNSFNRFDNPFGAMKHSDEELMEFVKRQKAEIKELQDKLEHAKQHYKEDKAKLEEIRNKDPNLYKIKSQLLAKVKETIEKRIDKVNQRIAKVKEIEAKIWFKIYNSLFRWDELTFEVADAQGVVFVVNARPKAWGEVDHRFIRFHLFAFEFIIRCDKFSRRCCSLKTNSRQKVDWCAPTALKDRNRLKIPILVRVGLETVITVLKAARFPTLFALRLETRQMSGTNSVFDFEFLR